MTFQWLNSYLKEWIPNLLVDPESLSYLGISGSIEVGSVTYLAFSPCQKKPLFCLKIYRAENAQEKIEGEAAILKLLAKHQRVGNTVPSLYFAGRIEGVWILIQSVLPGAPMALKIESSGLPELTQANQNFAKVMEWISGLNEVDSTNPVLSASNEVSSMLSVCFSQFEFTTTEKNKLRSSVRWCRQFPKPI